MQPGVPCQVDFLENDRISEIRSVRRIRKGRMGNILRLLGIFGICEGNEGGWLIEDQQAGVVELSGIDAGG